MNQIKRNARVHATVHASDALDRIDTSALLALPRELLTLLRVLASATADSVKSNKTAVKYAHHATEHAQHASAQALNNARLASLNRIV